MSDAPTFASSILDTSTGPAAGSPVELADLSHQTKLVVKTTPARQAGLRPPFGGSEPVGEALVCGTRPGEWTVLGPADAARAAVAGVDAAVVDLTHGRLMLEVSGPAATSALEKVCSLDWSDDLMPDGAVTSASVAKVTCDVIRRDRDGRPAYLLLADRSFGQYLFEAIADATVELSS